MAMAVVYDTLGGTLLSEKRGATVTEYVSDPLGSLKTCNDSSGSVTYTATYWPYGEVRSSSGSNPSPWGFVGLLGYLTDTTTRIYVRMRHYLPKLTRWLTVDPIWWNESAYGYCLQLPVGNTDPMGLRTMIATDRPCARRKTCIESALENLGSTFLPGLVEECLLRTGTNGFGRFLACMDRKTKKPKEVLKDILKDLYYDYAGCLIGSTYPGETLGIDPCEGGDPVACCGGKYDACVVKCMLDKPGYYVVFPGPAFWYAFCLLKCKSESEKCLAKGTDSA